MKCVNVTRATAMSKVLKLFLLTAQYSLPREIEAHGTLYVVVGNTTTEPETHACAVVEDDYSVNTYTNCTSGMCK